MRRHLLIDAAFGERQGGRRHEREREPQKLNSATDVTGIVIQRTKWGFCEICIVYLLPLRWVDVFRCFPAFAFFLLGQPRTAIFAL